MRCFLVRHAQTVWNGENRLQGHSDLALSAAGHAQAVRVGEYVRLLHETDTPIRALYVSHLMRSVQTARAIAGVIGLTPTVEPAFAEISLGVWEGLTPEEIDARFAGAYERWRTTPSQVVIPGAESLEQFRARVREAFARILAAHRHDGAVVVVTHGGVIASLLADCLDVDYDRLLRRLTLDNAGVSAVDGRTQPPHVLWINGTNHLSPRGVEPAPATTPAATSS